LNSLHLSSGYYRISSTSMTVHKCPLPEACAGGDDASDYCAPGEAFIPSAGLLLMFHCSFSASAPEKKGIPRRYMPFAMPGTFVTTALARRATITLSDFYRSC